LPTNWSRQEIMQEKVRTALAANQLAAIIAVTLLVVAQLRKGQVATPFLLGAAIGPLKEV
jgi:hypothetical protein